MLPAAPGMFSTTNAWLNALPRRSASVRAETSVEEPGPMVTMILTGFAGQVCASAPDASASSAHTNAKLRMHLLLLAFMPPLSRIRRCRRGVSAPQLAAGPPRAFRQHVELRPAQLRVHPAHAAVGAGDDVLAPDEAGVLD